MREVGELNLTPVQYSALQTICQQPGIDQKTLATTIGYDTSTIGGVIDRLEHKGLVRRVVSAQDRRARELRLAPKGKRLLGACRPVVQALQADVLAPLSAAERAAFLGLARKALGLV